MSSDKTETRKKILTATVGLLESGTAKEVRMSDIAREAGVSRQAVYLHFANRADLLIAATLFVDQQNRIDDRLAKSRAAQSGVSRLDAYIEAWGGYIPHVYGISRALMAMMDTDEEAASAWNGRMQAMRHGCQAVIDALEADKKLSADYSNRQATDLLWTMLSVRNWEQLTKACGWSQKAYIKGLKAWAANTLVQG